MNRTYPDHAIYKLKGAARAAAVELLVLENEIRKDHPIGRYGNAITEQDQNLQNRDVMSALEKQRPELVERLGLDVPAVKIKQREGGHPRAYEHFPAICVTVHDGEIRDVFMACPLDYKGDNHKPENSKKIPVKDLTLTDFGEVFYRDQGTLSTPHLVSNERGTKLPADFDPAQHRTEKQGLEGYKPKVFIAGGNSLSCVQEYLERQKSVTEAKEQIKAELEARLPELDPSYLLGAEDNDELEVTCCFGTSATGKPDVWVRIDNKSKDPESGAHEGSRAVAIKDNDLIITNGYSNGSFRIKPNIESEPGRKLDKLFARLSSEPDLGSYWQLWNPTPPEGLKEAFESQAAPDPKVPALDTIRGVHYLVYTVEQQPVKDNCHAPGGIPVNTAEYLWLKDDIADEERCITPAEPPPQLTHLRPLKPSL